MHSMGALANALFDVQSYDEAVELLLKNLETVQRLDPSDIQKHITCMITLANCYLLQGKTQESLRCQRDVYALTERNFPPENLHRISSAGNYAMTLMSTGSPSEALPILRETLPVARRVLGPDHEQVGALEVNLAQCLYVPADSSREHVDEAFAILKDLGKRHARVFGRAHPQTQKTAYVLKLLLETTRERGIYLG